MSHTCKRLYAALEAAQVLMSDWIDGDEKIRADFVIFPPESVDAFTDDEEVNENAARLGDILPNDMAGSTGIDTNYDFESTDKLLQFTA